ncbi:MAG: pseudaminic acid biosynthesis-associated methylase [Selenomonadaceae bacterium]|nr:pseudaminic acid biosynthesis-associated methylase [Selenomonadaceae bacterium]
MNEFKTEQESFWAGDFGNEYIGRNSMTDEAVAARISQWCQIINNIPGSISDCLEFGTNIGINLKALGILLPHLKMSGIEINERAAAECRKLPRVEIYQNSILDFETSDKFDLTFTSGVLIHINPDFLPKVYDKLYNYSKRYILVCEYYNPTPVEVLYRNHTKKLFKRDFAGEILAKYPDVRLIGYGFFYHLDNNFPNDDFNWFLMEKGERK